LSVAWGDVWLYAAYMRKRMSHCSVLVAIVLEWHLLVGNFGPAWLSSVGLFLQIDWKRAPSLTFVVFASSHFGSLPGGLFLLVSSFLLLVVAALTSAISMLIVCCLVA